MIQSNATISLSTREIYDRITTKLTPEEVNLVNTEDYVSNIPNDFYKDYFSSSAGSEHYKLLMYISGLYVGEEFVDLGTHIGCSTLALSATNLNKVHSFDVVNRRLVFQPNMDNQYYVEDIMQSKNKELFEKVRFIMLDTAHDGSFEKEVYDHLKSINWKGILLLDDIFLNDAMKEFWEGIDNEKKDITYLGHFSGTGIVIFE